MREIWLKFIEVGEHILVDGVEYVAMESTNHSCKDCDFYSERNICKNIDCSFTTVFKKVKERENKDDTPMTQLQFAEWLSKGNGQYRFRNENTKSSLWVMYKGGEDLTVDDDILIRPWGTDEWIKPTLEIYMRDCKK